MIDQSYPTLAMLYPLVTDIEEFQSFRDDASDYLTTRGIAISSPVYRALTTVSRGGMQTRQSLAPVVQALLAETGAGDTGPTSAEGDQLPLLGAFHRKYVLQEDVPWGPYTAVAQALVDELFGTELVW